MYILLLSERSKPFSHFLYGITLLSSLPKIPLWERFTFLIVHGELQFPRFVKKRIGETSLSSYNMGIFGGTDSMPDSQSIQHHPSMERVPSSDGACSVVGCGVFHRRMRRITRPATRCSVGSSMPHRLYDPESHNRGGVQQTAGRTACGNGPGKAWFPVWQREAHGQTERKNMRCKLRVTDKCRNSAIPWMANFFDKRSEQARILSLGMKKERDSFCPALIFS